MLPEPVVTWRRASLPPPAVEKSSSTELPPPAPVVQFRRASSYHPSTTGDINNAPSAAAATAAAASSSLEFHTPSSVDFLRRNNVTIEPTPFVATAPPTPPRLMMLVDPSSLGSLNGMTQRVRHDPPADKQQHKPKKLDHDEEEEQQRLLPKGDSRHGQGPTTTTHPLGGMMVLLALIALVCLLFIGLDVFTLEGSLDWMKLEEHHPNVIKHRGGGTRGGWALGEDHDEDDRRSSTIFSDSFKAFFEKSFVHSPEQAVTEWDGDDDDLVAGSNSEDDMFDFVEEEFTTAKQTTSKTNNQVGHHPSAKGDTSDTSRANLFMDLFKSGSTMQQTAKNQRDKNSGGRPIGGN